MTEKSIENNNTPKHEVIDYLAKTKDLLERAAKLRFNDIVYKENDQNMDDTLKIIETEIFEGKP